jgi:hypothetical protein
VLAALGRITFFADGRFGVDLKPVTTTSSHQENLFLQRLTPIVAADVGGAKSLLTIDTGSTGSFFTERYFREHKMDFKSQLIGDLDLIGAGGSREVPMYLSGSTKIGIGGGCITVRAAPVLTQATGGLDNQFYGNVGQNILGLFQSYTFDFQAMNFRADGRDCAPTEQQR